MYNIKKGLYRREHFTARRKQINKQKILRKREEKRKKKKRGFLKTIVHNAPLEAHIHYFPCVLETTRMFKKQTDEMIPKKKKKKKGLA